MSNNDTITTGQADPGTTTDDVAATTTPSGSPARTSTEAKLWEALAACSGASTAELALRAGIGKSTAGKTLARWHDDGHVTRTTGQAVDNVGGSARRAPATWAIPAPDDTADPATAVNGSGPDADDDAATIDQEPPAKDTPRRAKGATRRKVKPEKSEPPASGDQPRLNTNGAPKLRSGELRGQVEDHLRDRPNTELSPAEIANVLGRSGGAISNALAKLTDDGVAVRTQDKPKRYRLADGA